MLTTTLNLSTCKTSLLISRPCCAIQFSQSLICCTNAAFSLSACWSSSTRVGSSELAWQDCSNWLPSFNRKNALFSWVLLQTCVDFRLDRFDLLGSTTMRFRSFASRRLFWKRSWTLFLRVFPVVFDVIVSLLSNNWNYAYFKLLVRSISKLLPTVTTNISQLGVSTWNRGDAGKCPTII